MARTSAQAGPHRTGLPTVSRALKICVVGAGAIGGYLAAKLSLAGYTTSIVARGPQLDAIRSQGIRLVSEDGTELHAPTMPASNRIADHGKQDYILLALKAYQVGDIAAELARSLGPNTSVVAMQNGIPWWYFLQYSGPYAGHSLEQVDPGQLVRTHLPSNRVIGAVVHKAAFVQQPGVIHHSDNSGDRFTLGELDGSITLRVSTISEILESSGIAAPVISDIRNEKWYKLWGNLAFNPICALTQANCLEAFECMDTRDLALSLMEEARRIAEKLGVQFRGSPMDRMMRIPQLGPIRPSMLQDAQSGRTLEVGALLGSLVELGRLTDTEIPHIESIYACTRLLARVISSQKVRIVAETMPRKSFDSLRGT